MVKGDGEYCTYCKRELVAYTATHPTRDHVMPRSRGAAQNAITLKATCCRLNGNGLWRTFPDGGKRVARKPKVNALSQNDGLRAGRYQSSMSTKTCSALLRTLTEIESIF